MYLNADLNARVSAETGRPFWRLADPLLYGQYVASRQASDCRIIRFGLWTAVATYIVYGVFDIWLFPDISNDLIATRTSIGILFLIILEFFVYHRMKVQYLQAISAICVVSGGVAWLYVARNTTFQVNLSHFMIFGAVFILGCNLFFRLRFWLSALSSLAITVIYAVVALRMDGYFDKSGWINAAFFCNICGLSLYLSWQLSVERYQTFLHALQAEIKTLEADEKGRQLVKIADSDPLTGLKNRRALGRDFEVLRRQWVGGASRQLAAILLDVDFFKRFNDRLGHQAGDDCLVKLAHALEEETARSGVIAGRFGGEEFLVIGLVENVAELRLLSSRLCEAIKRLGILHPDRKDDCGVVTISVGASMTRGGSSGELPDLLREADSALYAAKSRGRAGFTIFDPSGAVDTDLDITLDQLLDKAIEEDLLSLVFQPIYSVGSRHRTGFETLMRLRHPGGEMISPEIFIPAAEMSGLIDKLGLWAIETVCFEISRRKFVEIVSINLSPIQLKAPGFTLRVAEMLGRFDVMPRCLAFEITESFSIAKTPQAVENIRQLRELGIQVWLDDFGTGYAGLDILGTACFDLVKIDREFLNGCDSVQGTMLLCNIVNLIRGIGASVLIEGVETEQQCLTAEELKIDFMQGYHLGRPLPIDHYFSDHHSQTMVNRP